MPRLQDWDETFLQKDSISTHPEKGITAMQKLFEKHKDAILSSPDIAESFLKKKLHFSAKPEKILQRR